jgi:hypothetical protein
MDTDLWAIEAKAAEGSVGELARTSARGSTLRRFLLICLLRVVLSILTITDSERGGFVPASGNGPNLAVHLCTFYA